MRDLSAAARRELQGAGRPQGVAGRDGATGPQGPAGPAGATGSRGPAGAAATYADPIGSRLLDRLAGDVSDASILVLGDSTGNKPGEWPDLVAKALAGRYPRYTVTYRQCRSRCTTC